MSVVGKMATQARVPTHRDLDSNTLFENHTVEEVRAMERKIRNEIEWKKEEMRDLVGERYRDLISAADTIKQMKECAVKVNENLTAMHQQCQKLKEGRISAKFTSPIIKQKTGDRQNLYEVACEIKFLIAVPGKLWKFLDCSDFLPAAQLYLLAKHVHDCLQFDKSSGIQIGTQFPVIARQWTAISHFKNSILQGCKQILADFTESDSRLVNAVCALLILEEKTPRQVFQDFLVARMFNTRGSVGVKKQISSAIQLLHNTVFQISTIFASPLENGSSSLSQTMSAITTQPAIDSLAIEEFTSLKPHLPKIVTVYKPVLRVQNVSLTDEYLKTSCDKWLTSCLEAVQNAVEDQLGYITSISGLHSVRETVWQIFLQDRRLSDWLTVCEGILPKPVNLWTDLLCGIFSKRIHELISIQYSEILQAMAEQLRGARTTITSDPPDPLAACERDSRKYIWVESANDVPTSDHWLPSSIKTFQEGGGLLMKAHGFTPLAQSLARKHNDKLAKLLNDIDTYCDVKSADKQARQSGGLLSDLELSSHQLVEHCCRVGFQAVIELSETLRSEFDRCGEILHGEATGSDQLKHQSFSWLLVIARLSTALQQLAPELERSVTLMTSTNTKSTLSMMASSRMSMSRSAIKPVHPMWAQSLELLANVSSECCKLWSNVVCRHTTEMFANSMAVTDTSSLLINVTRWDDIDIEEDSETGEKIKSTINVPMQVTWCLQKTLNCLCEEINKISAHALNRSTVEDLVSNVLLALLRVYESHVKFHSELVTQRISLQYLLDIWYLQGLLSWRNTDREKPIEALASELIVALQSRIDPFDLDVFSPYIHRHQTRQKARHATLLGAIADTEKVMNSRQPTAGQEQHNMMPLYTSTHTRFSLLPVSADSDKTRYALPTNLNNSKLTQSSAESSKVSLKSNMPLAASAPVMKASASFYEKIGAMSWFAGNKS